MRCSIRHTRLFLALLICAAPLLTSKAAKPTTKPSTSTTAQADTGNDSGALPPVDPDVTTWPTMDYAQFMAGHSDEAKRQQMWKYFLIVERQAKSLAGTRDHWKMLKSITLGNTGPKWFPTGRLQLGETSRYGTLFHEVFHNTYNGSALHAGEDNAWSEAFCDAFRYMMEKAILPDPRTAWFVKVDHYSEMTFEQVMARSGDKHFDQQYCYPASLIIRKAEKDPRKFCELWFALQKLRAEKQTDILDAYFGYDMRKGQPTR